MKINIGIIASSITEESAPPVVCADVDGQAFITAVGTLDSTEEDAICALVQTLKSDGLYTKCFAIYPFAGTIEDEQKWQLKDPRDLDAAFRLNFVDANWTFSITGAQMVGSLTIADTFFNQNTLDETDCGITVACRSNTTNAQYAFGNGTGGSTNIHVLSRSSLAGGRCFTGSFTGSSVSPADAKGVVTITRSGTTQNAYKNSVLEGGPTTVSGSTLGSSNIRFGIAAEMEFCFGVIHEALDATQVANLHAAIDTYSATYAARKNW